MKFHEETIHAVFVVKKIQSGLTIRQAVLFTCGFVILVGYLILLRSLHIDHQRATESHHGLGVRVLHGGRDASSLVCMSVLMGTTAEQLSALTRGTVCRCSKQPLVVLVLCPTKLT